MSFRRRALFLAGLFVAVSCSDAGNPIGPDEPRPAPPRPEDVLAALTCTITPRDAELRCAAPAPRVGDASGIYVGGTNGDFVRLTKIGHNVDADSLWFDVTLRNFIGQTLGTQDGINPHADGVRIFFETEPSPSGPGIVEVVPSGTHFFFDPEQPYYQYAAMLADSAVSAPTTWKFKYKVDETTPGAMATAPSFSFTVLVAAQVKHPQGWLDIVPDDPVVQVGGLDSLTARIRNQFGRFPPADSAIWSSGDPGIVTVTALSDTTAEIAGVAEGTAWVHAVSALTGVRRDSVLVTVNNAPVVTQDSISALENVTDSIPTPRLQNNVTEPGATVVPGSSTTWAGGQATVTSGGGLVYRAPAGYSGKDTVTYQVTDGTWTVPGKVVVQVEPTPYWYVRAGGSGDGRDRSPFGTIAAAQAVAGAADSIFVLSPSDGTSPVDGPAVLKNRQALIGQGVTFDVTRTLNGQTVMVFDGTGAAPGLTRTGAGPTVTVAEDNIIRGLGIGASGGAAITSAAPFDSLFIRETDVSATGPALDLTTGTIDAVFGTLSAVNSASSGITLTGVDGSVTAAAGAISITGAGGTAVSITGGVNVSYPGNVTQGTNNPLLAVANHTGTLSLGGTLQATAGTGVQFSNASGSYTFGGTVNLNGGDAGLDVNASGGVFDFANASITNPSGPALSVVGGTPALIYRGSITHNTGRAVVVDGITADSVVVRAAITSGTAGSPTGLGILVQNVSGGRVALDSTKSLFTGANPAVTLASNTGGLVRFGHSLDITTTSGSGFTASGTDTVTVTGNNTVATGTGTPVSLTSVSTGATGVSFSSVSTSGGAANGIVLNGITGVGVQVTGGGISGTTGAAVSLTSTAGVDSVSLRGMSLSRGAAGASVVSGSTFGKLHLLNTAVMGSGGAGALSLSGGTLSGSLTGLTATGAASSSVSLTSVGGSLAAPSGSLSVAVGGTGPALDVSGGSVSLDLGVGLTGLASTHMLRVSNGHTGTLNLNGANSMSATGSPGFRFENADGVYNVNVTAGTTALSGDSAGIDILPGTDGANGSQGTFQFGAPGNGFAITSGAGTAFNFQGSAADVTFHGGITKNGTQTGRMVDITGQRSASAITFQTGTLSATSTSAASTGILLNDADGTVAFGGTTTLNGGDAGIDVENGSSGTITFAGTSSVANAAGELIRIVNSAPTFTYSGAFQRTTGSAVGILAQNNTGGTITFNGDGTTLDGDPADVTKSLSTGTANAVSLVNNGGTTFQFAGGMTLATTSGTSFNATGGGTVNVSGAGNTANATSGTAVRITDTDIGAASGVVFRSVSAAGGANGIFLQNTGTTGGGFGVMGDGSTNGSGGTIANASGADGATAGNGVYLNNVRNVSLSWMGLSGHANNGLFGTGVRGLTMNKMRFTGNNGNSNSGSFDESAVNLVDLGGGVKVTNSRFDGGAFNAFRVENVSTGPALDSLIFENDTVESMQGSTADVRGSAILVTISQGTAPNTQIRNSRVTQWWANGIHVLVQGTATGTTRITNNFVDNTNGALAGAGGIAVAGGNHTYNISGNTVRHTDGTAISADRVAAGANMNGTISGNTIGVSGDNGSGSRNGNGIFASHHGPGTTTHRIHGNTIRQVQAFSGSGAIWVLTGDAAGFGGSGTLNATVTGNNIQEHATLTAPINAHNGILATVGTSSDPPGDTDQACLDIGGAGALANVISNFNNNTNRIRVSARFGTTSRFPGYTGTATTMTSQTDLASYLTGRNPGTTSVNQNTSTGGFLNTVPAGSACPQPSI